MAKIVIVVGNSMTDSYSETLGEAYKRGAESSGHRVALLALARVIMTMGMPGWFYRWYFGAHALKLLKRNALKFSGVGTVRSTIYGMIEAVGDDKRKQWLREVEALGHQAR